MAEDFSRLEAILVDAAKAGNTDHVIALLKDVGRLHHLWQPNPAQAVAIENAANRVLRRDASSGGDDAPAEGDVTDLQQNGSSVAEPVVETVAAKRERLIKGYMVSSVNEWGADQTRILLITDEGIHRVKYDFHADKVLKWHTDPYDSILRIEYGNFKAAEGLSSFLWRRAIDDQQGFRVYTAAPQVAAAGGSDEARREAYREFRALLAEAEPWKEEVFMLEIVAALQAMKILRKANFEIKLTKMLKSIPGGVLAYMHNANRRRQHGTS